MGGKKAGQQKSVFYCGRQKCWVTKELGGKRVFIAVGGKRAGWQKSWEAKECCFQSWAEKECLAKGGKDSLLLNVAKVREEMELQPKIPNLYFSRISLEPLELQKSFLHLFAFLSEELSDDFFFFKSGLKIS